MRIGKSYLDSDFSYTVMLILLIDHYLDVIVPTFHLVDVVSLFVFVLVSSCLYIIIFRCCMCTISSQLFIGGC